MLSIAYSIADQNFATTASVGIYNISLGLVRELAADTQVSALTVFSNSSIGNQIQASGHVNVVNCDGAIRSTWRRILWDQMGIYKMAKQSRNDWLLLPKGFASFVMPCPVKLAVYVHDIMSVFYGKRHPEVQSRRRQIYFQRCLIATLRNAVIIFTNTEFTKSEIREWANDCGIRCPPIVVAGYGFVRGRTAEQKKDQILVFVRHTPHKLPGLTLKHVARWEKETSFAGKIICVGTLPRDVELPPGDNWEMIPRLQPEECVNLMGQSRAVVHFSEYEGFGMPPVEAVLAGTPAVYSDIPAMREVMDGTGCPSANDNYESFAHAMEEALSIKQQVITEWGDRLSRRHRWSNVCSKVVEGLATAG